MAVRQVAEGYQIEGRPLSARTERCGNMQGDAAVETTSLRLIFLKA